MSFLRAALKKKIEKQGNVRKGPETPKPTSKFLYSIIPKDIFSDRILLFNNNSFFNKRNLTGEN